MTVHFLGKGTYLPGTLKLSTILPNTQLECYQVEYFKKYPNFIKYIKPVWSYPPVGLKLSILPHAYST